MNQKHSAVLSVDFKKEFSNLTGEVNNSARVCIDLKAIQVGLIKEVGANRVAMLLAIVAYMDASGRAFPSQEKIAELTGQGRATIQRNVDALCEVEFNGQRLLFRETIGTVRKQTVYTLNQALISNTDDIEERLEEDARQSTAKQVVIHANARDVGKYFLKVFEDSFGYQYSITWKRDLSMIKNKLIDKHDNETLKAIVDVGVGEYKKRWASERYPHPTIGMLCGWLGNEAVGIYNKHKEQEQTMGLKKQQSAEQDQTAVALDTFFNE